MIEEPSALVEEPSTLLEEPSMLVEEPSILVEEPSKKTARKSPMKPYISTVFRVLIRSAVI